MDDKFTLPFLLKSTFAQTMLAGSSLRNRGGNSMLDSAYEVILDTLDKVKLQGFNSMQPKGNAKGLVLLLHGWEGSSSSAYILSTGRFLYHNGFSVFRLNYRDHGDTHHLNKGLFYAVLLDEVFNAVQQVSEFEKDLPFYLAGFSMGGNFALRIARKCAESPIPNLKHVMSISPVLDPDKSTQAIDNVPLIRKYFRRKWMRSLQKKQELYPELYDFSDVFSIGTVMAMTDLMVRRYSDYPNANVYFNDYSLKGEALNQVITPTTIITSQDDPIIPVEDFYGLNLNSNTDLIIQEYGGHNGFIETLSGTAWYEKKMLQVFE